MKHIFQEFDHVYTMDKPCKIVNVFAPFDCNQNCVFCSTKEWYKDANYEKWKISLNKVIYSKPNILIITGGEPLLYLDELNEILKMSITCPEVYINTSFNTNTREFVTLANDFFRKGNLKGVNISRHYPAEIPFIDKMDFPIRINAVLEESNPVVQVKSLIDYYKNCKATLTLRENYTKINRANLYDFNGEVLRYLTENYLLIEQQYCHFCSNFTFMIPNSKLKIRYHRGTNLTSAKIGTITEHMELVLAPNGIIYSDWDKTTEGVEELLKCKTK